MYDRYDPGESRSHPPPWMGHGNDDDDCGRPHHHHHHPEFHHQHHQPFHHHPHYPDKCLPAVALLAQAAEVALAAPGAVAWCTADVVKGAVDFARHIACDAFCCAPRPDLSCYPQKRHYEPPRWGCDPDPRCCPKPLHFHRPSPSLSFKARENEKRISSILIENNMADTVTITPSADAWRDAWGRAISGSEMQFLPTSLVLDPRKSGSFQAITEIEPNSLEGGKIYYTQIHLPESRAKPLSVSLTVVRETQHDVYTKTDPCRCDDARWLEVCHERDEPWWLCCDRCGSSPCRCGSWGGHPEGYRPWGHHPGSWEFFPWWSSCQWHSLSSPQGRL